MQKPTVTVLGKVYSYDYSVAEKRYVLTGKRGATYKTIASASPIDWSWLVIIGNKQAYLTDKNGPLEPLSR